jgi:DNA-binding NarL/FixJ family response regulator
LSLLDVADGRHRAAVGRLWAVMRTEVGRGHLVVQIPATPTLVEAAVRCGLQEPAREAFRAYDGWARSTGNPTWLALSARCRALLATGGAEKEEHFAEAVRLHLAGDSEFALARTELLFGQWLRRARRPADAREHLRRAAETFELFGAATWAALATEELRATGGPTHHAGVAKPGWPARRVADLHGPGGERELTAQQLRIARMVADGATNREIAAALFLSPRTVDHHLRNIFARLGLRSRTELAHACHTGDLADAAGPG